MSMQEVFNKERYDLLVASVRTLRLSSIVREMEARKGTNKGLIFPFARGLRFSAQLIYILREVLSGSALEVNWGQILEAEGDYDACSPEGDIIIHRKGHVRKWNGGDGGNHIMDYRFISKDNAIAVVSCKSFLTTAGVEKLYCERMVAYCPRVWLFAECCGPESAEPIRTEAKSIGYEHFWHLYTWSRTLGEVDTVDDWNDFMKKVEELKAAHM